MNEIRELIRERHIRHAVIAECGQQCERALQRADRALNDARTEEACDWMASAEWWSNRGFQTAVEHDGMDGHAITAELHRRGSSHAAIGRKLGYTTRMVGYVISGERTNARIRREIARVIGTPVATLWPDANPSRKAA